MDTAYTSLRENAKTWDLEKWSMECSKLLPEQLNELAILANAEHDAHHWQKKLHQLFILFPAHASLEAFGRNLNSLQALEILHFVTTSNDVGNRQKLSSLFVGISPAVFQDVIAHASQQQLYFLREEAVTEAIQHNLSLIVNELNTRFTSYCNQLVEEESKLNNINFQAMSQEDIQHIYRSIESYKNEGNDLIYLANRSLTIAWNTNRIDLIQELGRIKELCQKCLVATVGNNSDNENPPTGLWQLLEKKVDEHFSDYDTNGNVTLMKDTTPALEALVKFSVWYVHDYYDVGLLPQVRSLSELELNHSEDAADNLKKRERLFSTAEENLKKIGISTLHDLKTAKIYSKKALMEYISASHNKITS